MNDVPMKPIPPPPDAASEGSRVTPGTAPVTSRAPNHGRDEAHRWVRQKRIFYTITGIYLSLSLMWFAIDALDDSSGWWFYWPMLGTGLGVVVTGMVMFGFGGLFGADWEQRQVQKYLDGREDPQSGSEVRS